MENKTSQYVYPICRNKKMPADVSPARIGSKAYNLMRMAEAGVNIPPAIVIDTQTCAGFLSAQEQFPQGFDQQLQQGLEWLEHASGRKFGDVRRPLLVSVRSGAAISMPGMMETILNVGLNDASLRGLVRMTGNPRMAWDSYRRLIQTYAEVVHGFHGDPFEKIIREHLHQEQLEAPEELSTNTLQTITGLFLRTLHALSGHALPDSPQEQLTAALKAVFRSWNSDKAVAYRRLHQLDDLAGTAALIQSMVFGNAGATSGAGVGFTRDPASGDKAMYLDFLFNAQGEDVVAGHRSDHSSMHLETVLPEVMVELHKVRDLLETLFSDMQDFEFTVENERLYLLQTRRGNRTPWAGLKIAMDFYREGAIDEQAVMERLQDYDLDTLERTSFAPPPGSEPLTRATPASIGSVVGSIALSPARAIEMAQQGQAVILVRESTATEDISGIAAAQGLLTAAGFRTSHASVVARQMGKVCLVGCHELSIDPARNCCCIAGQTFTEGDLLSLDGNCGAIYAGEIPLVHEKPDEEIRLVRSWQNEQTENRI